MKNLTLLFLTAVLVLSGCTANSPEIPQTEQVKVEPTDMITSVPAEPMELSVLIPFGSPALSLSGLLINEQTQTDPYKLGENITYHTEIINGADPLVAAFASQSHDVIIAPTNLGAKFYNTGIPYKYCGAIVYGNLFLVSLDKLESISDLEGKEIVAFSQNSTPDIVLQTIIKANGLTEKVKVRYVGSVSEAQGEILAGTAQVALLAEPILSVTKTKVEINILDLQDEWSLITGAQSYPQAGIFIKSEMIANYPDVVNAFLEMVQTSIHYTNSNPTDTAAKLEAIEFGLPAKIIESAIPNSHLVFETALGSKNDLEFYYNSILDLNPVLIGGQLPDADFYQ